MSTQTTNLGLTKPAGNERPLVSVLNDNMDIIDDAVGDLQDSACQKSTDNNATVLVGNLTAAGQLVRVVVDGANGRYALLATDRGISLYDSTNGQTLWAFNKS